MENNMITLFNVREKYIETQQAIDEINKTWDNTELKEQIKALKTQLSMQEAKRMIEIEPYEKAIDFITNYLASQLVPLDIKSADIAGFKVSMKITKSLKVIDIAGVVEVLRANNKVAEGVKSFSLEFLRGLKNADLLDDKFAKYDEKENVKIELIEGGDPE